LISVKLNFLRRTASLPFSNFFKMTKPKERDVVRKQFYLYCPICKKEIKGSNSSQVEYNLKNHIEKCEKEKK